MFFSTLIQLIIKWFKDQKDFEKADKSAYLILADKLDAAGFDQISIEDAHRHNDLELFQRFKKSKVISFDWFRLKNLI